VALGSGSQQLPDTNAKRPPLFNHGPHEIETGYYFCYVWGSAEPVVAGLAGAAAAGGGVAGAGVVGSASGSESGTGTANDEAGATDLEATRAGRLPETGGIQRLWAINFLLIGAIKL